MKILHSGEGHYHLGGAHHDHDHDHEHGHGHSHHHNHEEHRVSPVKKHSHGV